MSGHHHSSHEHDSESGLKLVFWLNAAFAVFEIAGGLYTNSLSILSNAFHDLGDSAALGLAWYFQRISLRQRDALYTYGYKRFSLVGALITSVILLLGSLVIITESIPRLLHPEPVNSMGMLVFAVIGILVNGAAMFKLKKGESRNEKMISLHLLEDVLGWGAVLITGILLQFIDFPILDPLLSLGITVFILFRVFQNMRQTFRIFLQAVPQEEMNSAVETALLSIEGIHDVHDFHSWTLDGSYHVASLHMSVNPNLSVDDIEKIKQLARKALTEKGIDHVTIETEPAGNPCELHDC
jgi:cobalt-zinc-cadmium efflux system protein